MEEQENRREVPRVCVIDDKPHIRRFLRGALSGFGFKIVECAGPTDLRAALEVRSPDLVVLILTQGGKTASAALRTLAEQDFGGKILPVAQRGAPALADIRGLAERLRITILPPLLTPFTHERLRDSITPLLPDGSANPVIDISEAVSAGWLELWYQPKIDARAIVMRGAEALLRVRHPVWGIVPPAFFIADDGDPRLSAVSETVISRALEDWHYFFLESGPTELAINLPIAFLQNPSSLNCLRRKLPHHNAFDGLIVESNGTEIVRNLNVARDVAKQLRLHKIAISVDDVGAEWPSFTGLREFPFVEVKIDRKFIVGCAKDRLKQSMCRRIIDLARSYGARTVAEGVESWADFLTLREMGVDLAQGVLFAKPMSAEEFAQTCWVTLQTSLPSARSVAMGELGLANYELS